MTRVEALRKSIDVLYQSKNPDRADWADWLYQNHIYVVSDFAGELAERYGADKDLAIAAGMLHDVADAVMAREAPDHEVRSWEMARLLLADAGFSDEEIQVIVDDAIRFHGCHGDNVPVTLEGRVMATGDALGHLKTDFYDYALRTLKEEKTLKEVREWALPKIERDYRKKIQFDEVREEAASDYKRVKALFSA